MKNNNKNKQALTTTIKRMLPVVSVTMIGTGLGLLSLYRSKVPMIQNFGTMLTIGIIIAFIIVLFVFMPILYVKDEHFPKEVKVVKPKKVKKDKKSSQAFDKVLDFIMKFKYIILFIAIALAVVGIVVDQSATAETNIENFMPQDSEALQDIRELRDALGSTEQIAILLTGDNILSEDNLETLKAIDSTVLSKFNDEVTESQSLITLYKSMGIIETEFMNDVTLEKMPLDQRKLFINNDYTVTVINVSITEMDEDYFIAFIDELEEDIKALGSNLELTITGQSVIDAEMMDALTNGRYEITIIGLILIFITLLLIYRSFYRAILPLIPIILIIGWSGGIMAIFGLSYTPLTATLGALIMGIGTDYTILITERFQEEINKSGNRQESIKIAISKMGRPILVSALTTMGGFSALIFSDFIILSNFGIMTVISFSLALLSAIFILPAILAITFTKKTKVEENLSTT